MRRYDDRLPGNVRGGAGAYAPTQAQQHTLIQRVCFLLASGLLVTALGAYAFRDLYSLWLVFCIAMFGLLFLMMAVARKPGINVLVFYLFSLAEGGLLGPTLAHFVRAVPNGANLVWEAFVLTSLAVAGVGGYAYVSGRDFGFLGRGLFWELLALIFVGFGLWFAMGVSPGLALNARLISLGYETIVLVIFTGFLLYDFSNIRLRFSPEDYTIAAVTVYLDFLNLFLAILNILAALQGGGSSRRN